MASRHAAPPLPPRAHLRSSCFSPQPSNSSMSAGDACEGRFDRQARKPADAAAHPLPSAHWQRNPPLVSPCHTMGKPCAQSARRLSTRTTLHNRFTALAECTAGAQARQAQSLHCPLPCPAPCVGGPHARRHVGSPVGFWVQGGRPRRVQRVVEDAGQVLRAGTWLNQMHFWVASRRREWGLRSTRQRGHARAGL